VDVEVALQVYMGVHLPVTCLGEFNVCTRLRCSLFRV
jgi:hypothetical protein